MLIRRPEIRIVSKEVILATGELVCAFFAVMMIEGRTEVRFLGTKPVEANMAHPEGDIILLAAPVKAEYAVSAPVLSGSVFSPFFSLDLFANQLARAPNLG